MPEYSTVITQFTGCIFYSGIFLAGPVFTDEMKKEQNITC
jgi:hypothetical protein